MVQFLPEKTKLMEHWLIKGQNNKQYKTLNGGINIQINKCIWFLNCIHVIYGFWIVYKQFGGLKQLYIINTLLYVSGKWIVYWLYIDIWYTNEWQRRK